MDKKERIISDAPESNAGDDFHVLWSIRKSLELLNTDDSALKAISGSIIHRLSSVFNTYLNAYDRNIVLQKIRLKLVSNRNVAKEVTTLINDVQNYLQSTKSPTLAKLKSQFPKHVQGIDLLKNASKLKANDFIYFLKILVFSDCGTGSRFVQKQRTIEAIVQFAGFSWSQFAELNVFVRDKMMPENRPNNLITEKEQDWVF